MGKRVHLGRLTVVDRKPTWRCITAVAILHIAEAGDPDTTITVIADPAGVRSAAPHLPTSRTAAAW
jgi:hypothetical protein